MSKQNKKNIELIEKCYVSELYEANNYDDMSLIPIISFFDCEFSNVEYSVLNFKSDEKEINSIGSIVRYLKFNIKSDKAKRINLVIHNNYRKVKIWQSNVFLAYINGWYEKILIDIDPGVTTFTLEVLNMKNYDNLLISIIDNNLPIIEDKIIVYNDTRDVKRYHIITNSNIGDSNGFINFSIRNYFLSKKNDEVICFVGYLKLIENSSQFIVLDKLNVKVNEVIQYNINSYKSINEPIIVCVSPFGSSEFTTIDKFKCVSYIINKNLSEYNVEIKEKIDNIINTNEEAWKREIYELQDNYIKARKSSENIKYYLYKQFYEDCCYLNNCLSLKEFILKKGIKNILIKSRIDCQPFRFPLYTPTIYSKDDKLPLIVILASNSFNTYIETYSLMYPEGYLIVECSTRGKHFGNEISNSSVMEVINYIKAFNLIDEERIYLIGHSSSGTTATTLVSKYPHLFAGCLTVSCLCNTLLLGNAINNKIINICGSLDPNKILNFDEKEEFFIKSKHSYNILVENINDYVAATFLRNAQLIDNLLSFKAQKNLQKFSYTSDNLFYSGYNGISIIKKLNFTKSSGFQYEEFEDEIMIITENVQILKIENKTNKKVYINKHYFIDLIKNELFINISDTSINIITNISKYEIAKYKLEISNMYIGGLKIFHNIPETEMKFLSKFSKPQALAIDSTILVDYPIYNYNENIYTFLEESNYLLVNYDVNNYMDKCYDIYFLECFDNGFKYKDKFYAGNYSIIQVLPNVSYLGECVTFINYNNYKMVERNFFIRNVFLPSDHSVSSYYRNCALIYYINNYFFIPFNGSDMQMFL